MPGSAVLPFAVDLVYLLYYLKKPCTPGETVGFHSGRYCQADSLFGAALIGNNKVCGKSVETALDTFHAGIE